MNDFLDRVVAKVIGTEPTLTPRRPSLFESSLHAPPLALVETALEQQRTAAVVRPDNTVSALKRTATSDAAAPSQPLRSRAMLVPSPIESTAAHPHAAHADRPLPAAVRLPEAPTTATVAASPSPYRASAHEPMVKKPLRAAPVSVPPLLSRRGKVHASSMLAAPLRPEPREYAPVEPTAVRSIETNRPAPNSTPSLTEEPVVRVSIGRLEVRASPAASPSASARRQQNTPPSGLETYLRQRGDKPSP